MTNETQPTGETPAVPAQSAETPVTQAPTQPAAEEVFDKDRAMATINALREIEKKSKQDAKELARLKADEQKRIDANLSETEKLKKQADELAATNAKLQADILRRDVIAETGLPAALADRLKGNSKEEMLADAQELLKVLPKQTKTPPHIPPTDPASGQGAESEAQKRERIFGKNQNAFDMNAIQEGGGGVVWNNSQRSN